jgi:hypothetical protein
VHGAAGADLRCAIPARLARCRCPIVLILVFHLATATSFTTTAVTAGFVVIISTGTAPASAAGHQRLEDDLGLPLHAVSLD